MTIEVIHFAGDFAEIWYLDGNERDIIYFGDENSVANIESILLSENAWLEPFHIYRNKQCLLSSGCDCENVCSL
jgi:hypothetical protein